MVVRVDLGELRRSAEDFSRSIGIPPDVKGFIAEFLEKSKREPREAVIFVLETKIEQIDFTLAVIDKIINKKFIDLLKPFLNKKLRDGTVRKLEEAIAKVRQARQKLIEQIERLKHGERAEIKFVVGS